MLEHSVGERQRDLGALADRRLQHELARRMGPASARPQAVHGQGDGVGEMAGVTGPAKGKAEEKKPPLPVSIWGRYAKVLLSSSEFLFVN